MRARRSTDCIRRCWTRRCIRWQRLDLRTAQTATAGAAAVRVVGRGAVRDRRERAARADRAGRARPKGSRSPHRWRWRMARANRWRGSERCTCAPRARSSCRQCSASGSAAPVPRGVSAGGAGRSGAAGRRVRSWCWAATARWPRRSVCRATPTSTRCSQRSSRECGAPLQRLVVDATAQRSDGRAGRARRSRRRRSALEHRAGVAERAAAAEQRAGVGDARSGERRRGRRRRRPGARAAVGSCPRGAHGAPRARAAADRSRVGPVSRATASSWRARCRTASEPELVLRDGTVLAARLQRAGARAGTGAARVRCGTARC